MDATVVALAQVFSVSSLAMLLLGVVTGLMIGVIPGIGGLFGLVILVPMTFGLDPYSALALLLGLAAVTTTSDTVPAVLIGVPGTAGAITTIEDGHPMAKNGEATRALSAAYFSSMAGGVFGALILSLTIPIMGPLLASMQTADFLAVSLFGLLFVASVSGRSPNKGIMAALLGLLLSIVGLDPINGQERFTFGMPYLWDGLSLPPVFLGVFALPMLARLAMQTTIYEAPEAARDNSGVVQGLRDVIKEWWLVLRCSGLGAALGAVPGVGVMVIDWIAYGIARRDRRGGPSFGKGNVRGVIAPEAANNAKEGGYLIPTIAFGLPGSATMAVLLSAFAIHGLTPGPDMIGKDLPITISMVYFLVIANIIGGLLCLAFTRQLSMIAVVPLYTVVPVALLLVTLGAFQVTISPNDLYLLVFFGFVGIVLTLGGYSRPAFALGFILGGPIERYAGIAFQIHGWEFLLRPSLWVVGTIAIAVFVRMRSAQIERGMPSDQELDKGYQTIVAILFVLIGLASMWHVSTFSGPSQTFGRIITTILVMCSCIAVLQSLRMKSRGWFGEIDIPYLRSGLLILGYIGCFSAGIYTIGHLWAAFLCVTIYVVVRTKRLSVTSLLLGIGTTGFIWLTFDMLTSLAWPEPLLASVFDK